MTKYYPSQVLGLPTNDAGEALQVVVLTNPVSKTAISRSATATTTSSTLMVLNQARLSFFIKNDSAVDVWVNLNGPAVASAGGGNIRIASSGYLELAGISNPVAIIAASGTAAVTAYEV